MTTTRLSESQLVILTAAAGRNDGAVLPLPASLTVRGGARNKVLRSLIKRGMIEEHAAAPNADVWREADDGQRIALAITSTGLEAIGIEPSQENDPAGAETKRERAATTEKAARANKATAKRPDTKQALVLDLLRRKNGVSVAELMQGTGWQAHSVRGFLSGAVKKKLALPLVVEKDEDGARRYHVAVLAETTS